MSRSTSSRARAFFRFDARRRGLLLALLMIARASFSRASCRCHSGFGGQVSAAQHLVGGRIAPFFVGLPAIQRELLGHGRFERNLA